MFVSIRDKVAKERKCTYYYLGYGMVLLIVVIYIFFFLTNRVNNKDIINYVRTKSRIIRSTYSNDVCTIVNMYSFVYFKVVSFLSSDKFKKNGTDSIESV